MKAKAKANRMVDPKELEALRQRLSKGPMSWRPKREDVDLIVKLYAKKTMDVPTLLRLGLRALAEVERVY